MCLQQQHDGCSPETTRLLPRSVVLPVQIDNMIRTTPCRSREAVPIAVLYEYFRKSSLARRS